MEQHDHNRIDTLSFFSGAVLESLSLHISNEASLIMTVPIDVAHWQRWRLDFVGVSAIKYDASRAGTMVLTEGLTIVEDGDFGFGEDARFLVILDRPENDFSHKENLFYASRSSIGPRAGWNEAC